MTAGNSHPLTLCITTKTLPDTEELRFTAENNLMTLFSSDEVVQALAQALSEEFEATIKLTSNVHTGRLRIDMMLGDLSRLDYMKELSDEWVLSNIVDSILMTPEFIESCGAEDVAIDVVLDEESYQQVRSGKSVYTFRLSII